MQSAYAYALWLGLAPPESEDAVLSALIENVVVRSQSLVRIDL